MIYLFVFFIGSCSSRDKVDYISFHFIILSLFQDRQLKGLPTLGTTAAIPSNRNSRPQSQSLSSVACHLKECVLSDLEIWSNEMFIDFKKLKDSS